MLAACGHDAHEKEITLKSIYGDGAAKAKYPRGLTEGDERLKTLVHAIPTIAWT